MYEYGNIDDAKPGDIVECTVSFLDAFTKGKLYIVASNKNEYGPETIMIDKDDKGSTTNGWYKENFKLIKTKLGSEAKIGDTVICIQKTDDYAKGYIYRIREKRSFSGITLLKDGILAHRFSSSNCFLVLCKAEPVTKNPFKKGDKVVSLTTGSSIRFIGSQYTVHMIDGNDVYYSDCLSTHYKNFRLLEREPNPIPEEETMNENITIAMAADEYAKYQKQNKPTSTKTDLEQAPKWLTIWYGADEREIHQTTQSPKEARKTLQKPDSLGYTFRSYKIVTSATTDVSVVDLKV